APLRVECTPGRRRGTVSIGTEPSSTTGGQTRPVDLAVDTNVSGLHAELLRRLRTLDDAR
ncbi:MAG: hypothetical protein J2P19_13705, partial [Pseudonocardia sp.]|nr:hypothetical protein [Pseudonocardia sp.]